MIRTVAGRRFVLRDGTWTDTAHDGTQRVIEIEAFSPGHFQVLEALPELESWLREFDDVLIAGAELSIRVGPNGLDRLGAPAVERLVEAFRGH